MPNAIVLNTRNGAVTEYSGFDFQSITPTHAGSAVGLYELGGNLDVLAPIAASVTTGKRLTGKTQKNFVDLVLFAMKGAGKGQLTVLGENASHTYSFPVLPAGVSRCKPGKGIRENYLAFGFGNVAGASFEIDRIEVLFGQSSTRRT